MHKPVKIFILYSLLFVEFRFITFIIGKRHIVDLSIIVSISKSRFEHTDLIWFRLGKEILPTKFQSIRYRYR